ncbi:kinesin-domain-containing protein, partial [Coniophora puteana RWD-64-598 SS2]
MDVSRVDPEEALVDADTVDHADVSMELDEQGTGGPAEHGKEDKVLVSIRVRPTDTEIAWDLSAAQTLKLIPSHARSASALPQYHFDEVLTGTANRPVYTRVARGHVGAAMDGYNAVVFAYGQTCSGKTFTLVRITPHPSSPIDNEEPGIIPLAMKDVFAHIRRTPAREYLLRCSYIEIYNEQLHDLLAAPSTAAAAPVQLLAGGVLSPLREEVVTSLKGVRAVLERGARNRRTACTDWNERSSRSHSVFRLVIESRERGATGECGVNGRTTPAAAGGRQTPSRPQTPYSRPCTPGGTRLQTIGGRSVQTSVLSLIDLAGSEKATSDKERTREGKFINTSLLTLGTVISTLAENASKAKADHVPYRNSKLTRLLQPSLAGDARISVVCTINPEPAAVGESTSTLGFASRIKKVQLHARKREVVDADALIERYRKEIEGLRAQLAAREAMAAEDREVARAGEPAAAAAAAVGGSASSRRRVSRQEREEESVAMGDLNARIQQLTRLILTSQSVGDAIEGVGGGSVSVPGSPSRLDFDMSPYQLQQELLAARRQIDSQANQILSLEEALLARPLIPPDAPESQKDRLLAEQGRTIRELEIVVRGYEENLGEPLRAVREDVEHEWEGKVQEERRKREEGEVWAREVVRELEREKRARQKLEEERRALTAFVSKFDSIGSS